MILRAFFSAAIALALIVQPTAADETCMSPYMAKIVGQEDYVYIWTLGLEGVGDGEDKLVTVDVNPDSETYGTVIHSISMGGRHEAHHSGLTDDRRYLWASGSGYQQNLYLRCSLRSCGPHAPPHYRRFC